MKTLLVTGLVIAAALGTAHAATLDFGDAPAPYPTMLAVNGARHTNTAQGLRLGTVIDFEADGQPSNQDDVIGVDDEDGVTFLGSGVLTPGIAAPVRIVVSGGSGLLNAWVDFARNNDWTPGEQIYRNVLLAPGTYFINFPVPSWAVPGSTWARFRLSTVPLGIAGPAPDGEVEDYPITIGQRAAAYFSGLPHEALGDASLLVTSNSLSVLNLNSNAQNGFRTLLGQAQGYSRTMRVPELMPVEDIFTTHFGTLNNQTNTPALATGLHTDGSLKEVWTDMRPLSATSVRVECFDRNGQLKGSLSVSNLSRIRLSRRVLGSNDWSITERVVGGSPWANGFTFQKIEWTFADAATGAPLSLGVLCNNENIPESSKIVCTPEGASVLTPQSLSFSEVSGLAQEELVTREEVQRFGLFQFGTGGAQIIAHEMESVVSALGNTATDGLVIDCADDANLLAGLDVAEMRLSMQPIDVSTTAGQVLRFSAANPSVPDIASPSLAVVNTSGGSDIEFRPGVVGSTSAHVIVRNGDNVAGEADVPAGTVAQISGTTPLQLLGYTYERRGFSARMAAPVTFSIPGAASLFGSEIEVYGNNTTNEVYMPLYFLLRGSNVTTVSITNKTVVSAQLDWGDAPTNSFPTLRIQNGARHRIVPGVYLGSGVDAEPNGQPNNTASGDDASGDDEDGVFFAGAVQAGMPAVINVVASTNGFLNAWVDFNTNRSWADPGEQVFTNRTLVPGVNTLTFMVPPTAGGNAVARFRFTTNSGSLSYFGAASSGEVEDYLIPIQRGPDIVTTKDSDTSAVGSGGTVTFTLRARNVGLAAATGVQLTDALAAGMVVQSLSVTGGTCNVNNGVITCYSGMIVPGSDITVVVTVDFPDIPTGTYTNTAVASMNEADPTPENNVARCYLVLNQNQLLDFGDAPEPAYHTRLVNNGPRHTISQLRLGRSVDGEADGQPNATATGDNLAGAADEDGVRFLDPLVPGSLNRRIAIYSSGTGKVNAWIDWNRAGGFEPLERVATNFPVVAGVNILLVNVPSGIPTGPTFARFRLNSAGGLGPDGAASDGEVEDYRVAITTQSGVNFAGVGHTTIGDSTLSVVSNKLVFGNDGTTMGMSVDLDNAQGWFADAIEMPDLSASGATFSLDLRETNGTPMLGLTLSGTGVGNTTGLRLTGAASGAQATLMDPSGQVLRILPYLEQNVLLAANGPVRLARIATRRDGFDLTFVSPVQVISGSSAITCSRVVLRAICACNNCDFGCTAAAQLFVTAIGLDSLSVGSEGLIYFGHVNRAIGAAQFQGGCSRKVDGFCISNLGSGGQDGLVFDTVFEGLVPRMNVTVDPISIASYPGATLVCRSAVSVAGGFANVLASINQGSPSHTLSADFSAVGAQAVRLRVYRDHALVGVVDVPNGVLGQLSGVPVLTEFGFTASAGLRITFSTPVTVSPSGGGAALIGDDVVLTPVNGSAIAGVRSMALLGANFPGFSVANELYGPRAPRVDRLTLNGTGFLRVPSETGVRYGVEYKNSLNDPAWITADPVDGLDGAMDVSVPTGGSAMRIFRVRAE